VPPRIWGDGDAEGVRQRAAEEMKDTDRAAAKLGVNTVVGFTGSKIWKTVAMFPPVPTSMIGDGYQDFADRLIPILDVFDEVGVRFAHEVHPSEIAYDYWTTVQSLEAIGNRQAFGLNWDPSHFVWQDLDPVGFLWDFRDRIYHEDCTAISTPHVIDAVRFLTGEEIVTVDGAIEHTFIEERALLEGGPGGEIAGAGATTSEAKGRSTVDDAVLFIGRLSGGGLASFEATRLATGYHNANRIEIHGERGAIRFDFERMNELGFYDASGDGATPGWTTIDVTRGGDGHPYAGAWWPDSHGLGYENTFVNQAADMLEVIGGGEPVVPLPDFADALETQKVLSAALISAREHAPIDVTQL
jgi:hypothetical protein